MGMKGMSIWLPLIGYLFVAVVAVFAALRIDNQLLMVLLIISATVSLILAITRLISAKKTGERIKYLEEHHLSIIPDEKNEGLVIKEGI